MKTAALHCVVRALSTASVCAAIVVGCKPEPRIETAHPEVASSQAEPPAAAVAEPEAPAKAYPSPPAPTEPKPFDFPEAQTFTLGNGLQVYVIPDRSVPLVSAQLVVRCGAMDDEYKAPFTASMLGEGTRARTKAKLDEAIEFVGGSMASGAGMHVSYVTSRVMTSDLKLALTLMADQVINPVFPPQALEKQKQQAKTALSVVKARPEALAGVLLGMVAYPEGHPYGRPLPGEAEIDAISIEEIRAFHDTFYRANNAFLVLAGAIEADAARPLVERTLGQWKPAKKGDLPPNPLNRFTAYELPRKLVVHLVDRPGSAQAEVLVGNLALARSHEDWVELEVANAILGDDASGRLFQDIRERRGLTYGIYSELDPGQAPGLFSINTRTRTKTTGAMLAAIFEHVNTLRAEIPGDEEVARAVRKLVGRFPLELETPGQIASKVREGLIYDLSPNYWEAYRDELLSVDARAVHKAANRYIHPIPHVVVVGVAEEIEPQLGETLPGVEIRRYDDELRPR